LKWAQTADGFIATLSTGGGQEGASRLLISNEYSNRLVHKWRSEEAAILIGSTTALTDDPELTTRLWPGPSPVRLVVDMNLKLPSSLKIFNGQQPTIIFNTKVHSKESEWAAPSPLVERVGVRYYQVTEDINLVYQIVNALYQLKIQSVIVEGGARLLQSFIDEGMWDEARKIKNYELRIMNGLPAPILEKELKIDEQKIFSDMIEVYKHES
jgi:diaminohydroxyphosphoribosylaminopyrimidine deaminase/5-amino-6-(5-phosphoribosylamino)uracil reductase